MGIQSVLSEEKAPKQDSGFNCYAYSAKTEVLNSLYQKLKRSTWATACPKAREDTVAHFTQIQSNQHLTVSSKVLYSRGVCSCSKEFWLPAEAALISVVQNAVWIFAMISFMRIRK